MAAKHQSLEGHEFEQTLGDLKGRRAQGSCCAWSHKESDMTE